MIAGSLLIQPTPYPAVNVCYVFRVRSSWALFCRNFIVTFRFLCVPCPPHSLGFTTCLVTSLCSCFQSVKSVSEVRYYPQNFTLNLCVFLAVKFWISGIPRREIFSSHDCKLEWINCGHVDWIFDVVVVYSAVLMSNSLDNARQCNQRLLLLYQ